MIKSINEAIGKVIDLTQGETSKNSISVSPKLGADLPVVVADRVQLQQVMLNLIVNAIEAMRTMNGRPRELEMSTAPASSTGVQVAVRDTGPGLPPAETERVFDAFFTTKAHGPGMGLSICRSIVEAYGGIISARANSPNGAVFEFTLPGLYGERAPNRKDTDPSPGEV